MTNVKIFVLALVMVVFVLPAARGDTQKPAKANDASTSAAEQLADVFSKLGDQIYEDCIFELSQEQVDVQYALIRAYIKQGADGQIARRLAAKQIQPPKPSDNCERIRRSPTPAPPGWNTTLAIPKQQLPVALPKPQPQQPAPAPAIALNTRKGLPQWDCAPGVDYVTIHINGYERKLTGGEICSPYQDVVREVPASMKRFRLGYTIKTGRLFVMADGPQTGAPSSGQTIAWAISGRDICRNNPDPDCLAARAVGPLPPGEYAFAAEQGQRVSWGPKTKRHVAGIYLRKLWNKDRFSAQQTSAILARGNIAIHMRLKGEMSEACIGLEPKGWAYVASLIKDARASGINVYIDEPYPQFAENPPVVIDTSFSLTSLFK